MNDHSDVGYSGEQAVDQPVAPTATGTDWFAEAKFGLFIHIPISQSMKRFITSFILLGALLISCVHAAD